jgi:regulator of cell morphogenesis and NO signaling
MNTLELNDTLESTTVAEIAIGNPGGVGIFNKYNIDYCCGGKATLSKACDRAGVSTKLVANELRQAQQSHAPGVLRFETWDVSLLIDFIVQHHHEFVKRTIPLLRELIEKVHTVHGNDHPELKSIRDAVEALSSELLEHMQKEEQVLFPAIRKLFNPSIQNTARSLDTAEPIHVLEDEHQRAGDLIKSIRSLTRHYTPPSTACPTYRLTYTRLQEFDQDLMQHIHLENNVLFEKVKNH